MAERFALSGVDRARLEPLWRRRDIPIWRIAEALGVAESAVRRRAVVLGLGKRTRTQKPIDEDLFARMWAAGVKRREMQRHFGFDCRQSVYEKAERMGLPRFDGKALAPIGPFLEAEVGRRMSALSGMVADVSSE